MSCGDHSCSLSALRQTTPLPSISPQVLTRKTIYESIVKYFGNPMMYKVESPNYMYSMYVVGVSTLSFEKRYVIAVCRPDTQGLGAPVPLSQLQWVSLQTRVTPTDYRVPHVQLAANSTPFTQAKINRVQDQNGIATYSVEGYPLKVQLIGKNTYRNNGSVEEALETFTTVLFFD